MSEKKFIKKEELQLINGGYLSDKDGNPVYNKAFVEAQEHAHYIVTFAKMAKGKDFVGKEAESLDAFKKEVQNLLYAPKVREHVTAPKKPENTLTSNIYM